MLFSFPAIETVRSGEDRVTRCLMARAISSLAATLDLVDESFLDHATVGVLSQYTPTCSWRSFTPILSSTSHSRRTPANSRSELVISPFGFENDTTHHICIPLVGGPIEEG